MGNIFELDDAWLLNFREEKQGTLLGSPTFFKGGQEDGLFLKGMADFIFEECASCYVEESGVIVALPSCSDLPGYVATLAVVHPSLRNDEMAETFMLFRVREDEVMWWVPTRSLAVKDVFSELFKAGASPRNEEFDACIATWGIDEVFSIAEEWMDSCHDTGAKECLH